MKICDLKYRKKNRDAITMLSCYDSTFANLLDESGLDVILVGDSLGMVIKGHETTLTVKMQEMTYHTKCVSTGVKNSLIMTDMPFSSYQQSPQKAYSNASKLIEAGAHLVKLEGNNWINETVEFLANRDIPVCCHIGLLPQSIHKHGGYKLQGVEVEEAKKLLQLSKDLERSGAECLVLELVSKNLAKQITDSISIPTIGIESGPYLDGQVLVLYDILGLKTIKKPKSAKNFLQTSGSIKNCVQSFISAVKDGSFPGDSS